MKDKIGQDIKNGDTVVTVFSNYITLAKIIRILPNDIELETDCKIKKIYRFHDELIKVDEVSKDIRVDDCVITAFNQELIICRVELINNYRTDCKINTLEDGKSLYLSKDRFVKSAEVIGFMKEKYPEKFI